MRVVRTQYTVQRELRGAKKEKGRGGSQEGGTDGQGKGRRMEGGRMGRRDREGGVASLCLCVREHDVMP